MLGRVPSAQSSYRDQTDFKMEEALEHRIHAEISPKVASGKAQTVVSTNRYNYPRIDFFRWSFYRF